MYLFYFYMKNPLQNANKKGQFQPFFIYKSSISYSVYPS
ncbi:hypothetical protein BCAH1134_C0451 (plasmid) [Bacillus cereus AH1134]|nr:hypothetical protein BCAH1134_C0451 [Bacillus cereus AH1134]